MDEYVDDGWSGTNFERPDFQRMMDDVEANRVNCIITKDLSRFGREHVMMDYYLEFYFPEKQVRYIAVSDNEDTDKVKYFRSFLPERGKKRLKMDLSLNFITVTDDLKLFAANSVSCKP